MGVLHAVLPLDATCLEWLHRDGISHPALAVASRLPTPREVADTLQQLEAYSVEITADSASGEWYAFIQSADSTTPAWASLRISHYHSDDEPHEFYFPKGFPEVIFTVVERLAHVCGPLVVLDDSSCRPIVVSPGDSIHALLQQYEVA